MIADRASAVGISPSPTDEEAAAIIAALEVGLPRPVAEPPSTTTPNRWRFSGRWWSKPVPARRNRPV